VVIAPRRLFTSRFADRQRDAMRPHFVAKARTEALTFTISGPSPGLVQLGSLE